MKTRIASLASVAREHGAANASNGNWNAYQLDEHPDRVAIYHYSTRMIEVWWDDSGEAHAYPISAGWGSQTDKCGINQILRHEKTGTSYWELFA